MIPACFHKQSERDLRERELRERELRERMPKQMDGLKMFATDPATAAAVMEQQQTMAAAHAQAQALMPNVHPSVVQGIVTQQALEHMRQQQPYAGEYCSTAIPLCRALDKVFILITFHI